MPGVPLRVSKAPNDEVTLEWDWSCLTGDDDYEIYEGTMADFYSHGARFCTTDGLTFLTFEPLADSSYFLVVPRNEESEGSYGVDSSGNERPRGYDACLLQSIGECP